MKKLFFLLLFFTISKAEPLNPFKLIVRQAAKRIANTTSNISLGLSIASIAADKRWVKKSTYQGARAFSWMSRKLAPYQAMLVVNDPTKKNSIIPAIGLASYYSLMYLTTILILRH